MHESWIRIAKKVKPFKKIFEEMIAKKYKTVSSRNFEAKVK